MAYTIWCIPYGLYIIYCYVFELDQNLGPIAISFGPFVTVASTRTYSLEISEVSFEDQPMV